MMQIESLIFWGVVAALFVMTAYSAKFFCLPKRLIVKVSFEEVLKAFTAYFFIPFVVSIGLMIFFKEQRNFIAIGAMSLALLSLVAYLFMVDKNTLKGVFGSVMKLSDLKQGLLFYVLALPVVAFFAELSFSVFSWLGFDEKEQTVVNFLNDVMQSPWTFVITVSFVTVFVPICEEILFRGFLQNWLLSRFRRSYAIVITSIIFSLSHGTKFLPLFVISCFMGLVYEKRGSLWSPIILHMTFNTVSIIVMSSMS
jgi:uncharacterized protein